VDFCTINWADSGPGILVPYYLTPVRAQKAVVVTASADCPDTYRWCDIAVGHFSLDCEPFAGTEQVLIDNWNFLRGIGQCRWAYLFAEGLVDNRTANAWANSVWPRDEEE